MKQNRCPYCGEYVQKNNLTCPKCFKEIPREPSKISENVAKEGKKRSGNVPIVALLLAAVPAFVGLLGLGMIYLHPKDSKGYWFLLAGLLLFLSSMSLLYIMRHSGILSAILLLAAIVILTIIYISAAIAAFLETLFGSAFKFLRL